MCIASTESGVAVILLSTPTVPVKYGARKGRQYSCMEQEQKKVLPIILDAADLHGDMPDKGQ